MEIESIEWWSPALAEGERMARDDPDRDMIEK